MAKADRAPRKEAGETEEARAVNPLLNLPMAPSYEAWLELADEAETFARLISDWQVLDAAKEIHSERYRLLMDQLVRSLNHLRVHSTVMDDALDEAMMLADELEERELTRG